MKIFKNIVSTIILASIAFIIPGSQMFGEEKAQEKEVLIYITIKGGTPQEQADVMKNISAGSTEKYKGDILRESADMKLFRVADKYDPDSWYFVRYLGGKPPKDYDSAFQIKPADVGTASGSGEKDWPDLPDGLKLHIIRAVVEGDPGPSKKPRILVIFTLGLTGWDKSKTDL